MTIEEVIQRFFACGDLCGALNCDEGEGGVKSCCGSGIQDDVICGLDGKMAPCSIGIYHYISLKDI